MLCKEIIIDLSAFLNHRSTKSNLCRYLSLHREINGVPLRNFLDVDNLDALSLIKPLTSTDRQTKANFFLNVIRNVRKIKQPKNIYFAFMQVIFNVITCLSDLWFFIIIEILFFISIKFYINFNKAYIKQLYQIKWKGIKNFGSAASSNYRPASII